MHAPALFAALVLLAAPAFGQNDNLVRTGRQQFDDLQYEECIQTLSAAIIRRGNTPAQEARIYETLGLAYLALNRQEEAEGAFRLLLARDPEHQLGNDIAPRIRQFFDNARQRWVTDGRPGLAVTQPGNPAVPTTAERPITIEHRSPAQQSPGRPIDLEARVVDPDRRAAGLVLAWRQGSRGLFRRTDTTLSAGSFRAQIPGSEVRPPAVEYYFEAVDENRIAITARGDAYAPLRVVVPAPGGASILGRWWFWTGAAVLVTGVAVGTYLVFAGSDAARLTINLTAE